MTALRALQAFALRVTPRTMDTTINARRVLHSGAELERKLNITRLALRGLAAAVSRLEQACANGHLAFGVHAETDESGRFVLTLEPRTLSGRTLIAHELERDAA